MAEVTSGERVRLVVPEQDVRGPHRRLSALFDPGTFAAFPTVAASRVAAGRGRVDGSEVVAFCTDATRMGGALGADGAGQIVAAIEEAVRTGQPVIGLWHSGGASLAEGVQALDGIGRIFAAMIHASGRVPQVSVVLGPAAGGAAYGPALTDVVIMAPAGRVFVTGPDVVRSVTGEVIDMAGLGGPQAHGRRSGVVHVLATSEGDALARARRITSLLTGQPRFALDPARDDELDPGEAARPDPRTLLPERPRRAYDVRPLVLRLLDEGPHPFEELQPRWAANAVIGLGRLYGQAVGVIANNPIRKGGCLDSLSAEKISRFVRMCDAFGLPLVVLVDVPGYLPGVGQEWEGVVRRGAKLLYAFAEATVPRVTLVTRKSFGGAYIAMNSRSLGATAVLAWPEAEVAVMGAEAAVGILHRRALAAAGESDRPALLARLAEEHALAAGGVDRGLALGVIDAVIEPTDTRRRIAEALADAPPRRGRHGNIPL
ncbi:putative propionyl-CoA carboxylase beta chain 6 [Frankia canadensis]|uniref:Putative propionyl-CoA carboxylase beta chain 6 n=1 Tax=Frankia canadensis TaxID=1836972 RepID=A0A2I2KLE1_9ACTN|nr:carboxyl transferase domain-containing protein [Frankia canadensis]SNQ46457.1 putative propionyl-CoA carboxylase beta chain 6 [Frankia canadensis]SOU53747.1 putative propionyl-CoA carboxylase beta chain 6 [Frankia canadensis]